MPRDVSQFLSEFVLPLVRGGPLHVGDPLDPTDVEAYCADLPHASVSAVAVDDARTDAIADLVVRPPSLVLGEDELFIAAAVHNLLFLEHPWTDAWWMTSRRCERVRQVAMGFAQRPPAEDRDRLLARHGLLHNLFALTRTDVKLTWWTGSATFYGQRPPARLRRWPTVRRVSEHVTRASYADLLGDPDVEPVVAQLVRLSPLTDLLSQPRDGPPLDWSAAVCALRDLELARAVAYRTLGDLSGVDALTGAARMAAAFERWVDRTPAAADVRAVAAFLVHLDALLAVAEARERDADAASALLASALAPERAARRPRGLGTLFALPDALARVDPTLGEPPGLRDDAAVWRRWRQHRRQVRDALSDAVIDALAARLRRALAAAAETRDAAGPPGTHSS